MSLQHLYKPSPTGEGMFYGWFSAMHTRVDVAMYGNRMEEEWIEIAEHIRQEILRLESIGNCFDEKSELAFVNRNASDHPVALSEDLFEMLAICKEYHARTIGCFDVTVHSQGYGPDTIMNVCLDKNMKTLFYERPHVFINLSGFIKGYALERIRKILKEYSVENALVNLGNSSILAIGNHPNGKGWKVMDDCILYNQCLTVSGNDSESRKHIVSPLTGQYVEGCAKVFVVTECGYIGEILSTALFAATDEQRTILLKNLDSLVIDYKFEKKNRR